MLGALPLVVASVILWTSLPPGVAGEGVHPPLHPPTDFAIAHAEVDLEAVAGRRSLAAERAVFEQSLLRRWGVPEDALLILQSQSSCGNPPPVTVASNLALLCKIFNTTRGCMGIHPDDPWMTGSGCKGRSCALDLTPKDSLCFLEAYGIDVDTINATRSSTCGLAPEDADWLKPFANVYQAPVGGKENCVSAFPPDVRTNMYVACNRGNPIFMLNFTFETNITEGAFGCITSPVCKEGMNFIARLLCYTEESASSVNGAGKEGRKVAVVKAKGKKRPAMDNRGAIPCFSTMSYKVVLFAVWLSLF